MDAYKKYRPFPAVGLKDRQWPEKTIIKAPRWGSVDLRDGNQALPTPMNLEQKLRMFKLLTEVGFKEIEVGFPAAAQVEFDFVRYLIEHDLIPEDVTIQVLTQARSELIKKTCQALSGARRVLIHLYNSTSELQRRVVFRLNQDEVLALAVQGTEWVKKYRDEFLAGTQTFFQYSPESFMGTELDFAVRVCDAVVDAWSPASGEKVIINLPNTVELATPNVWADQVEWFIRNFKNRERSIISVHCHNDRGTAAAASEFSIMAGAERVEGTLFGNGERTGNVDIVTLALNLLTQGVNPELSLGNINSLIETYQECTGLFVHPRHPYAGELVYTAFSGSHQDAINKGMREHRALLARGKDYWEVPYLPLDPKDVGRSYEAIVRINSQSGKGGVAYIMEHEHGLILPKSMQPEFGRIIQALSDQSGREVPSEDIWDAFATEYLEKKEPFEFKDFKLSTQSNGGDAVGGLSRIDCKILINGEEKLLAGDGNGPIDAFVNGWRSLGYNFTVVSYDEHAIEKGADARAITYIQIVDESGRRWFGAGIDTNIISASLKAIVSALNRMASAPNSTRL